MTTNSVTVGDGGNVLAAPDREQFPVPRVITTVNSAPGKNFRRHPGVKIFKRRKNIGEIIIASARHFFIQPACQINYTVCKNCRGELYETIGGDKYGSKEKSREEEKEVTTQ